MAGQAIGCATNCRRQMPYSVCVDKHEQQETAPPLTTESLSVAVVMRREAVQGAMAQWEPWRWVLADVLPMADLPPVLQEQAVPVCIEADNAPVNAHIEHWLFPSYTVNLHRDDAEGLYLNLDSPRPCFWVLWRLPELQDSSALPKPLVVTLSYHDAGRWLDAQERVDQVPAPAEVVAWMARFAVAHYQPEPKRRQRPSSFQPLTDRFGQPARISVEKKRGAGGSGG